MVPSLSTATINLDSLSLSSDNQNQNLIQYNLPLTSSSNSNSNSNSSSFNLASSSAHSSFLPPFHASQSFSYSPHPLSSAFINASVINNGFTLQLRWFSPFSNLFSLNHHDPFHQINLLPHHPPVQFHFDHRIIPSPYLSYDPLSSSLIILAITDHYTLYRLKFSAPLLFYDHLFDHDWCSDYDVEALLNRHIIFSHGIDQNNLILSCSDGFLTHLSWARLVAINDLFGWKSSNLSTRTALWSFLPSWSSSKTISSSAHEWVATPSSTIAMASHITAGASGEDGWLFTISRDRSLRIWSLTSGSCVRQQPLGSTNSLAQSASSLNHNSLLPAASRSLARFIYSDEGDDPTYEGFLVVFVPSALAPCFVTYGLAISTDNKFKDLVLLHEHICLPTLVGRKLGDLRDFQISKLDLSPHNLNSLPSKQSPWALWTIWDDHLGGEGLMLYTLLNETSIYHHSSPSSWQTIPPPERATPWNSSYFDELLANQSSSSLSQVFVDHLFQPGHFSPSDLEYALETYESQLVNDPQSDYDPQDPKNSHESLEEKICALVGANVQLELSPVTGSPMMDLFHRKLRVEWLKFATMCAESRASALWPLELAVDADHHQVFVLSRRAITTPILIDSASLLSLLARESFELPKPALLEHHSSEIGLLHPLLSNLQNRSDLLALVNTFSTLINSLASSDALRPLEDELVMLVKRPAKLSVLDIVDEIFVRRLDPFIDHQLEPTLSVRLNAVGDLELALQILWRIVSTSELVRSVEDEVLEDEHSKTESILGEMLLADYLTNIVERRYELTRNTLVFLIYLYGQEQDGAQQQVGDLASLLSQFLCTFHRTCVARWVCQQSAKVPAELAFGQATENMITDRPECDQWAGQARSQSVPDKVPPPATSLLSSLLHTRFKPELSRALKLPVALAQAGSQFLNQTGLFPNLSSLSEDELAQTTTVPINGSRNLALVEFLLRVGLADFALELVEMYPDCCAGLHYLKAQALVELGQIEDAEISFIKAGSGIYDQNFETDDRSGLSLVLPPDALKSLGSYYAHIVRLLGPVGVDMSIVRFCELAIESTNGDEEDGDESGGEKRMREDEMWNKIFKGFVNQGLWDDAYEVLISMRSLESQHNCLRTLVSNMCEADEVDKLLRYSFLGLENELERTLTFRARNSDPVSVRPNYYEILYAFYLGKGDYKSAAMAMYHLGRKIGEKAIKGGAFQLLMTQQCQSYLAAINALSLVPEKEAWVSLICPKTVRGVGGYEEEGDDRGRMRGRRGVEYYVPEDRFTAGTGDVEAVGLREIREEYTLVLSRLELANKLPELSQPGSATARAACLDGDTLVPMFLNEGRVTDALEKAMVLGTELEGVFVRLAESCARMTACGEGGVSVSDEEWVNGELISVDWEGTVVSKGWGILKEHLERQFPIWATGSLGEIGWRCREAIVETILKTDGSVKVPVWLLECFLDHRPDRLFKVFYKFDLLEDAFVVGKEMIEQAIEIGEEELRSDGRISGIVESQNQSQKKKKNKRMKMSSSSSSSRLPVYELDQLMSLREEDLVKVDEENHDESVSEDDDGSSEYGECFEGGRTRGRKFDGSRLKEVQEQVLRLIERWECVGKSGLKIQEINRNRLVGVTSGGGGIGSGVGVSGSGVSGGGGTGGRRKGEVVER